MLMTIDLWKKLKYFSINEKWGDPFKMSSKLVFKLDLFRSRIGEPFNVNFGTQGEHSKKSQHPKGRAVDGYAENIDLLQLYIEAEKLEFTGIGLYEWGIHLDVRPIRDYDFDRWCRIDGEYLSLTASRIDYLRNNYIWRDFF